MKVIELDMYQATAVAAIVLLLGRILVDKIAILRKYCIPAPVVGGFIMRFCIWLLEALEFLKSLQT